MDLFRDGYGAGAVLSTNIFNYFAPYPVLSESGSAVIISGYAVTELIHSLLKIEDFNCEKLMAKRFEKCQIDVLKLAFEESEHLTREKKIDLVRTTGLDMEQVTNWFNRKRACKRAQKSVGDLERINAELQLALEESIEKEAELQKKLNESKQREAELEAENQSLKQALAMNGGDSRFDSAIGFAMDIRSVFDGHILRP